MNLNKIWKEKFKIIDGVIHAIFKNKKVEAIAEYRLSLCKTCPLIDIEGDHCEVKGTQPCCGECGCSLKLKLRSMSSRCDKPGDSRWPELETKEEIDTFYERITKK